MDIKIGTDLTSIPKFEKAVKRGGSNFLNRIFHPSELKRPDAPHLAGVFAAKEAIIKTAVLPLGSWKLIEISHEKSGRPRVEILDSRRACKLRQIDVSISHDGDYAIATAIVQTE